MKKQIKLETLRLLSRCGKYLLPEARLIENVRLTIKPEPLAPEIKLALREMDTDGWIVAGRSALDAEPQWKLTAAGCAVLTESES